MQSNVCAALHRVAARIGRQNKVLRGVRLPHHLTRLVVVLGRHSDAIRHQKGAVETHTKLTNERLRIAFRGRLCELLCARLGNRAQIRGQLVRRHAHTTIDDVQLTPLRIHYHTDGELCLVAQRCAVGQRQNADLVERIGRVGDQLAQKHLHVAVDGIDDEVHQLLDLGLVVLLL